MNEETIRDALMYAQDLLDRCQIPFIVLGQIAYQMYYGYPLSNKEIVLGLMERHCVDECISLLPIVEPNIEKQKDGWRIMYHNYPVRLKIITKRYPTLEDPDKVFYWIESFQVPNPFDQYWRGDHYDI